MLPVEGGYYQWVKRAFGRFWGFWNGWLSWTYSLLDMAIYPVLFIQYLRFFAPGLSQLEAWLVALALIWGATWLNLRGTVVVGTASGWFVATVLLPFGVLAGVAIALWIGKPARPCPVTPFHAAGSSFLGALGVGVSQSIWNYSGWDNASTIGGEIEHATTTYPRALARALPLVTAVYLVSVIPVLALTPWTAWTDGAWPDLATRVVGPWLGRWLAVAGVGSAFALFNPRLLVCSRVSFGLARGGVLPGALAAAGARGVGGGGREEGAAGGVGRLGAGGVWSCGVRGARAAGGGGGGVAPAALGGGGVVSRAARHSPCASTGPGLSN